MVNVVTVAGRAGNLSWSTWSKAQQPPNAHTLFIKINRENSFGVSPVSQRCVKRIRKCHANSQAV